VARSISAFFTNVQGVTRVNFNLPVINIKSAVVIIAAEWQSAPLGPMLDGTQRPVLSATPIWVMSVGAHGSWRDTDAATFPHLVGIDCDATQTANSVSDEPTTRQSGVPTRFGHARRDLGQPIVADAKLEH
jgi:hypothetical protein